MKCSIIVPAFNEEKRIANCLNELFSCLPENYEIIVATDGCTDRTVEIAKEFPVKIATHYCRLGKGGGILNALLLVDSDNIMICDVDLSMRPIYIEKMVVELENADLVVGKRLMTNYPLHRCMLSQGFNLLFRLLFRIDVSDTQCGFKAVRTPVLKELASELHVKGFAFDAELIAKAHRSGFKVKEFLVEWQYKPGSKVNVVWQVFFMAKDLLKVWWEKCKTTES